MITWAEQTEGKRMGKGGLCLVKDEEIHTITFLCTGHEEKMVVRTIDPELILYVCPHFEEEFKPGNDPVKTCLDILLVRRDR